MCQDGLKTRKLSQSPNQVTAITVESFAVPVLDVFLIHLQGLKSQHVMQDTALEFCLPSGTGKLIPLLLDAGTSSCTRLPPPTDGIFQRRLQRWTEHSGG